MGPSTEIKHIAWRWEYLGDSVEGLPKLLAWVDDADPSIIGQQLALSPESVQKLISAGACR